MAFEITSLADYIGQENVKRRIDVAVKASLIQDTSFPHTLMSGPPGLGKTTLARIIAKECHCPFYSYIAANIDEKAIMAILSKLPKNGYDTKTGKVLDRKEILPCVVFIDEIHNLSKKITEMLHTVLENRTVTVKMRNHEKGTVEPCLCWVPEFTLVGATNYLGSLPKPFRDRFQTNIVFEIYTDNEIEKMLKLHAKNEKIPVENSAISSIATKSRGVPRIAISYFKKAHSVYVIRTINSRAVKKVTVADVEEMLEMEEVDNMGLTRVDRKAMNYLLRMTRPIGIRAFAQAIDEDVQTVENVIEPWLVKLGFVIRTGSGRYLTEEGRKFIGKERDLGLFPIVQE